MMDMKGRCCEDEIPDYVDDDRYAYQISYKNSVLAGFETKTDLAAWLDRPDIVDRIRMKIEDIDCYSSNTDDTLYLHDRGNDDEYHCASDDVKSFVASALDFCRDD